MSDNLLEVADKALSLKDWQEQSSYSSANLSAAASNARSAVEIYLGVRSTMTPGEQLATGQAAIAMVLAIKQARLGDLGTIGAAYVLGTVSDPNDIPAAVVDLAGEFASAVANAITEMTMPEMSPSPSPSPSPGI